jgi:hypothetical protein
MVQHTVLVQITGAKPFLAEVEVDAMDLNPATPPMHLTGTFIRYFGYETISRALVHTDPLVRWRFQSHDVFFRRQARLPIHDGSDGF